MTSKIVLCQTIRHSQIVSFTSDSVTVVASVLTLNCTPTQTRNVFSHAETEVQGIFLTWGLKHRSTSLLFPAKQQIYGQTTHREIK